MQNWDALSPLPARERPLIADNGNVVVTEVSGSTRTLLVYNNSTTPIASGNVGTQPGISDDGKVIAFNNQSGISSSFQIGNNWRTAPVITDATLPSNKFLDAGESWIDSNNNGLFNTGEDILLSFQPTLDSRVGISSGLTTVYIATDQNNVKGIYTSRLTWDDTNANGELDGNEPIFTVGNPTPIIRVGDTISGLGKVQELNIYDPINSKDQIAFYVKTDQGQEAVVKANAQRQPLQLIDERILTAVGIPETRINQYLQFLTQYAPNFGLVSARSIQAFIAQTAFESGLFNLPKELWGPTSWQKKYDATGNPLVD